MSIVVQPPPPPAGRCWNSAESTPEPVSAESEETVTALPPTAAPSAGAVSDPVGSVASNVKVTLDGASVLPTLSRARTRTV